MPEYIAPPQNLPPGSIVDVYLRDSGGPRQAESTDQQLHELNIFCSHYGLVLRNAYMDVAKSGGSVVGREAFHTLIDATRHPEDRPKGLLLWNYARFARDLDDAIYYKALLRNRNIHIHSITDPIPEGPYGRIIEFFVDISNEEKRRQTSSDAKRGLRDLVEKHGCVPGVPPRGFMRQAVNLGTRRDNTIRHAARWVPDPQWIPHVKRAFAMRAAGSTLEQIHNATHLYTGISSYKALFTNKLYLGILEFSDLVLENYCEPIIDMDTWNAVQARIEQHAQAKYERLHPRRVNSPYIISGLVYCGECNSILSANTVSAGGQRGRNEAYRCSRSKRKAGCNAGRIGRRSLEEGVLHTLREYILQPDSLAALYEMEQSSADRHATQRAERLSTLTTTRKKLAGQIANLTRAIAERGHSPALLDKLTALETERAQVQIQITEITNQQYNTSSHQTKDIEKISEGLLHLLEHGTPDIIREILQGFIKKIVVKKENGQLIGTITYFTPDPPPF